MRTLGGAACSYVAFLNLTNSNGEPAARDPNGSSCADAESYAIAGAPTMSLGEVSIRVARALSSVLRGILRGERW
jgi:hypothetical protein